MNRDDCALGEEMDTCELLSQNDDVYKMVPASWFINPTNKKNLGEGPKDGNGTIDGWVFFMNFLSRKTCWWFGTFFFPYIGNVIIPTDFHIFQRGGPTTNQTCSQYGRFILLGRMGMGTWKNVRVQPDQMMLFFDVEGLWEIDDECALIEL